MIKVLHTGDIHLGDLAGPTKDGANLRRLDTLACMDAIFQTAFLEEPDVTIIAGDLFNRSRVWADTALDDVNDALERFIRPLCKVSGAVVLLFGTMNHDNPRAYEVIRKATADLNNLHIFTEPAVKPVITRNGAVQIMAVPGFDKARLRLFCPGADKETENRNATALINDIILGLSTQLDHSGPSVMVAHYTVSGSEADNGSTFLAGQDVVILPSTIDAAGVDLACFGHIHKPQKLVSNTAAYYCGSPNQLTFNDEGTDHGFYIHEIDRDIRGRVFSRFERTPERRHKTVKLDSQAVADFIAGAGAVRFDDDVRDAIVRVRYTCTAEQEKALNRADIQKALLEAGAFYVAEIAPEDVEELNAKDQLTEHDGPAECLGRWMEMNDITGEKADRLMELAGPIIARADNGRDANKHTGAFIPKMIEVKNYRSYTEASFDFEPVHMAMVNGQNGVGKSSLFMDAIVDCLYEQTRKEDIGGWVRDGTKSGSITFTFGMGGQEYRVIRTRTKTGRGTLALQRLNQESQAWEDESDTTMKLTQAKIIRLLGMDCNTFCSIAIIRQKAYDLFLNTDSERRMEVLSALLGLDIYSRMEEIARDAAKEQRRRIASTKDRINILGERISEKAALLIEDTGLTASIAEIEKDIRGCESEIKALEQAEALRAEIIRQAGEKDAQARELAAERARKASELDAALLEYSDTLNAGQGLEAARAAAEAVKNARAKVQELAPKVERYREIVRERHTCIQTADEKRRKVAELQAGKRRHEEIVSKSGDITGALEDIAALDKKLEDAQQRMMQAQETAKAVQQAKSAMDQHVSDSRVRIGELEARLRSARDEADKLAESGCPSPDDATCKFLTSAVAAQAAIPELSVSLERMKMDDREKYEELRAVYESAMRKNAAMGDPAGEVRDLSEQRRKLQAVADLAPALSAAYAELEGIDAAISEAERTASELESRVKELDRESEDIAGAVLESEAATDCIRANERTADTLANCQAAAAKAETMEPQLARMREDLDALAKKIEGATREAAEIKARIPAEAGSTAGLRVLLDAHRKTSTDYATRRGEIKAKLDTIAEAEQQTAELRKEVESIASALDDYTTLVQAFGIDGIQYMIIRGVVPEIMRQSNEILASMTGGRMAVDIRTEREQKSTKQIVNSLEVWINTIDGGTREYGNYSGGEQVKIALAVTLGLADVKARRAGVQLGMLFIDEPPFLDASGTDTYADALLSMAHRHPDMSILAISHDPTMKARFSQNIIVSAGENGSTVEME